MLPFVVVSDTGPETFEACTVPLTVRAVTPAVTPSTSTDPIVVDASTATFAGTPATRSADAWFPRWKGLNIVRKPLVCRPRSPFSAPLPLERHIAQR